MALPESRNNNYVAADPVRSMDLNDLQDAVIEGWHGPLKLVVGSGDFVPAPTGVQTSNVGVWVWTAVPNYLVANIRIPEGTRIRSVKWFYDRGGAGTMTFRVNKLTGATMTTLNTSSSAAGTGHTSLSSTAIDYVLEADYNAFLSVHADNLANAFDYAIVTIDRLP